MRTRLACCAALVLATALTGCGGGSSHDTTANGTKTAVPGNGDDQMLAYARCLRQHGLDVPDPQPGQGVQIGKAGGSQQKMDDALAACRQYGGKVGSATAPAATDREVKIAQCMRQHGLDVPDPQPGQPLQIQTQHGQDVSKVLDIQKQCTTAVGGAGQ